MWSQMGPSTGLTTSWWLALALLSVHLWLPVANNTLPTIKLNTGICGNGVYHLPSSPVPQVPFTNLQEQTDILERLRSEPVVIKLAIFYDKSMAASFPDYKQLEKFIRNLVLAAQHIYEQPELSSLIRFNLVVISIREMQLRLPGWASSGYVLNLFTERTAALNSNADLNILINYRNFYERFNNEGSKVLGIAFVNTFCNPNANTRHLISVGYAYSNAYTLAHEIGHAIGLHHDGDDTDMSRDCKSGQFIMNPSNGGRTWSSCSISGLQAHLASLSECVYNSSRLATAVPVSAYFDFSQPAHLRTNSPGQDEPLDRQCEVAFRNYAYSEYARYGDNHFNEETCTDLTCSLVNHRLVTVNGPALPGSPCSTVSGNKSRTGICWSGLCVVT